MQKISDNNKCNNNHNQNKNQNENDYDEPNIQIYGTIFSGPDKIGDFKTMIDSGNFLDALFIYNDNEESYHSNSYSPGGGNAIIRSYNVHNDKLEIPFSFGIPTGSLSKGGYTELNNENKQIIDECILEIYSIIKKYNKRRLFYSSKDSSGILGTGIFNVSENVLRYITKKIYSLSEINPVIIQEKPKDLFDDFEENDLINEN